MALASDASKLLCIRRWVRLIAPMTIRRTRFARRARMRVARPPQVPHQGGGPHVGLRVQHGVLRSCPALYGRLSAGHPLPMIGDRLSAWNLPSLGSHCLHLRSVPLCANVVIKRNTSNIMILQDLRIQTFDLDGAADGHQVSELIGWRVNTHETG